MKKMADASKIKYEQMMAEATESAKEHLEKLEA